MHYSVYEIPRLKWKKNKNKNNFSTQENKKNRWIKQLFIRIEHTCIRMNEMSI